MLVCRLLREAGAEMMCLTGLYRGASVGLSNSRGMGRGEYVSKAGGRTRFCGLRQVGGCSCEERVNEEFCFLLCCCISLNCKRSRYQSVS
jgi:hypothetical protein